jgi:predicted PurR-regulated permease PerM
MFALPSVWNLIISTIVFFIAAWYIHRYLDEQGLPKGMTRSVLVLVLASLVSMAAGAAIDWAHDKTAEPQATVQAPAEQPLPD